MKTMMIFLITVLMSYGQISIKGAIKGNLSCSKSTFDYNCYVYAYPNSTDSVKAEIYKIITPQGVSYSYFFNNLGYHFKGYIKIRSYGYSFRIKDKICDTLKYNTLESIDETIENPFEAIDTMKPYIFVLVPKNVNSSKDLCIINTSEIFLKIFDNSGFINSVKIFLNKDSINTFLFEYNLSKYSDSSADSINIKYNPYTFKNPEKKVRIKAEVCDAYDNISIGYSNSFEVKDTNTSIIKNNFIKNKINECKIRNSFDLKGRIIKNNAQGTQQMYITKSSSKIYKAIYIKK